MKITATAHRRFVSWQLSLHGIGALEEGETHTDTNLLMEVLEIRYGLRVE
jgi:hypothetical protein